MKEYNRDLLNQVQAVDLEMAKYFVKYCEENGLLCYFCGGGCIGAVRHHGFIPWDDDLDFFMPRPDYEKLKRIWKDTEKYALAFPTKTYNNHNIFITLCDKGTTMIKPYQTDIDMAHGITIDIFPLDGCPSGWRRNLQKIYGLAYQLFCAQLVPTNHGKIVEKIGKIGLSIVGNSTLRYYMWRFCEKNMSKYSIDECECITEICAGPHYMKNEYPKEIFSSAILMDFEDTKMPIPVGYDEYLKIAFGNYMELPPKEKQVPQHDTVIIDPSVSYAKYRGKYYCV